MNVDEQEVNEHTFKNGNQYKVEEQKKRLERLTLSDPEFGQPDQKRQKMDDGNDVPKHDCCLNEPAFVDIAEAEEICCACGRMAINPLTNSNCGHVFGGAAVKALVRDSKTTFHCPGKDAENEKCQEMVETASLKPDRALLLTIQKKEVRCRNSSSGCSSTMTYKMHKTHLENECQFEEVKCPNCTEFFERRNLEEHKKSCRSQICEFAGLGCGHVTSSAQGVASTSSREHTPGLHMALLIQQLSKIMSLVRFSPKRVEADMDEHSKDFAGQEEVLRMIKSPDQTKAEAMSISELRTNYVNKKVDTKNHIQNYGTLLKSDFALQVAEPVFRIRARSQYLERQEEDVTKDVEKLMKDTLDIPILLNQGSIIFKVTNFSDKRTEAIKGELKRGVYGPQFYTHEYGYLMVPILYPNGDGVGAGTHLSIFIAIKKGKYDSLLPWPIMGRITISILSQKRVGREAVRHSFRTDVASLSYHRPTSDMNQASGIPKALELDLLKQPSDYLVDDTLFIQIVVDPKLPDR